jgi:hypothetical protein
MTTPNPPTEVALVHELMQCRQCDWIWKTPRYYGPFPRCDAQALPAANTAPKPLPIISFEQPSPAGLHGCRKAPIMVVGINPNLTGFFTLPQGGRLDGPRAVYPHFPDANSYAQHHRYLHEDRHEFRMEEQDVERLIDRQAKPLLIATTPGRVQDKVADDTVDPKDETNRIQSNREVQLKLQFDDGSSSSAAWKWDADKNFVVVPRLAAKGFQKDDVIAGVMTQASTVNPMAPVSIGVKAHRGSSFYRRLQNLQQSTVNGAGHTLQLGEDMSLHDMVACATPGWSAEKLGIDRQPLRDNCVKKNQYTPRQIVQSRPTLILFAGLDAFEMFLDHFRTGVVEPYDRASAAANVTGQGHARYTLRHGDWLAHLVIMGHLSYAAMPLTPFSLEEHPKLQTVLLKYPGLKELLQKPGYTTPATSPGNVCLTPAFWADLTTSKTFPKPVVNELEDALGDPRPGIVQQITAELLGSGALSWSATANTSAGLLQRNSQDCRFCETFAIPGGCTYAPK